MRTREIRKQVEIGVLAVWAMVACSAHASDGGAGPSLRITVRVQNYAQVAPAILDGAKAQAQAIFGRTGIDVDWVDCPLTGPEVDVVCPQSFRETYLMLRILPKSMSESLAFYRKVFGFALVSHERRSSFLASVFYGRVEELSKEVQCPRPAALGCIIAHEIGHLLLRDSGHSRSGIMRERLTGKDLLGHPCFDAAQAAIIRADVQERMRRDSEACTSALGPVSDPAR